MSDRRPAFNDRLIDLAIDLSTTGLLETERQELEELASSPENQREATRIELTAAAVDLAYGFQHSESMPRGVHDRLLVAAGEYFASRKLAPQHAGSKVELPPARTANNRFRWREAVSLAVTAACLMLLLSGYNPFARSIVTPFLVAKAATAVERLDSLIAAAPADLVDIDWKDLENKGIGGKVVWSDSKQEGYLVFSGLPVNNPAEEQYQLWIFDTSPNQAHPVDGGVFDITKMNQVVIPIDAKILVNKAVQFAITVEEPGGVVVSDRERLPLLATLSP